MKALNALLRWYAYLYFFLLSAFLAGVAVVAYQSGTHNINTGGMTSVTGEPLSRLLLTIGLAGIVVVSLAIFGKLRWLLPAFAILAVLTMFQCLFLSAYRFESVSSFRTAVLFFLGGIVAAACTFLRKRAQHGVRHSARK
jgi:hypothetical protein